MLRKTLALVSLLGKLPTSVFQVNTLISDYLSDTKVNQVLNGVCLPKVCLKSELLDMKTGLCISANLCDSLVNTVTGGLCKPKCKTGQFISTNGKTCLDPKYCPTALNTILGNGVCQPKTSCDGTGQLLVGSSIRTVANLLSEC